MFGTPRNMSPTSWEYTDEQTREQFHATWAQLTATPNLWLTESPLPNTSRLVKLTHDLFNIVYFITDRAHTPGLPTVLQTKIWLAYTFPGISQWENVIVTTGKSKGGTAADLKLTHFIDDRPKNCVEVQAAVPDCHVYMCNATWNKTDPWPGEKRVKDFDEFADIVRRRK